MKPDDFEENKRNVEFLYFQTALTNSLFSKSHLNQLGIILKNVSQVTHGCLTAIDYKITRQ